MKEEKILEFPGRSPLLGGDLVGKAEHLRKLETHLRENIKGQDHAITRVFANIKRGEFNLTHRDRPKSTFLFLGPTGVGKTELALQFTNYLHGPGKLFRFDMSEFMHLDSVKEFRGDETGQTGRLGQVLDAHESGTLLFDEMEKAHKQIMDLQLQILDTATVTLGNGKRYNLSKFYIVFTSNVGASKVMNARYSIHTTLEKSVLNELARQFRPEFIARFNEKIVFNRLTNDIQIEIAKITLDKELCRLKSENGFVLLYTGDVLNYLIREGIDVRNGARPLRNTIERVIQTAVADSLMQGAIPKGYLKLDAVRNTVYLETDKSKFPNMEEILADELLASDGAAV